MTELERIADKARLHPDVVRHHLRVQVRVRLHLRGEDVTPFLHSLRFDGAVSFDDLEQRDRICDALRLLKERKVAARIEATWQPKAASWKV